MAAVAQVETFRHPRALVFSAYPVGFFEKKLRPRFEVCGIEVVRLCNPDRSVHVDYKDADLVIALVALMSTGQKLQIRSSATRAGKRFVALSTSINWSAALKKAGISILPAAEKTESLYENVVPIQEGHREETTENEELQALLTEAREMIELFELENQNLEATAKEFKALCGDRDTCITALEKQHEETSRRLQEALTQVTTLDERLRKLSEVAQAQNTRLEAAAASGFARSDIIELFGALNLVRDGQPTGFTKLLELSVRLQLSPADLLQFLRSA